MESLKNKKVLMAIPVLYNGGTEEQMLTMIKCLNENFDVEVLCYFDAKDEMIAKLKDISINIHLLNIKHNFKKKDFVNIIKNKLIELKPNVLHVQYMAPGLLPIIAAKKAGIKTIFATVHQPGTPYGWKHKLFIRYAAFLCQKFICVSECVKTSWFSGITLNSKNIVSVPNAINLSNINHSPAINIKMTCKTPYIMYAGRMRHEKGGDLLIKAMGEIIKNSEINLIMAGDGSDKKNWQDLSNELNLQDKIHWVGHLDKQTLYHYMKNAKLGIVPSRFEGFGLTALEFIANGTPVIAHNIDSLPEIIKSGVNGYFYNNNSAEELSEVILKQMNVKGILPNENLKASILKYDIIQYKKTLLDLYQNAH